MERSSAITRWNPVFGSKTGLDVQISCVSCPYALFSSQVNCNDDLGVVAGKWEGGYHDGVNPMAWGGSAAILRHWASNNCSPVRYGQCWVFASVLCTGPKTFSITTSSFLYSLWTTSPVLINDVIQKTPSCLHRHLWWEFIDTYKHIFKLICVKFSLFILICTINSYTAESLGRQLVQDNIVDYEQIKQNSLIVIFHEYSDLMCRTEEGFFLMFIQNYDVTLQFSLLNSRILNREHVKIIKYNYL